MSTSTNNSLESKVSNLITSPLTGLGYDLVRVLMIGKGPEATLQIMAERQDQASMTVEDCTTISHAISDLLDAEPDLSNEYQLEVSSPGIDRPLMKLTDYARFAGHLAQMELTENIDGRRRFKATIVAAHAAQNDVEFRAEIKDEGAKTFRVPMAAIAKAKLVITDALLKAYAPARESA